MSGSDCPRCINSASSCGSNHLFAERCTYCARAALMSRSGPMCGIVGYVGRSEAAPILLDGLRRLEYRGYDSAGVAIVDGDHLETRKCAGRIAELGKLMADRT